MTQALIENLPLIADAPDGIKALRGLILDLAVRGKLVPQVEADTPVSEFLEKLFKGRDSLVEMGLVPKSRDLTTESPATVPFRIPDSWVWIRLDNVGAIIGGGTPPAGDPSNFEKPGQGVPWLTPADLSGGRKLTISRGARDLSPQGLASSSATVMPKGSVLFTSRAPIGYVAISENEIATNQGFKSVVPYVLRCSSYIAIVLRAFAPEIDRNAPGTTFKEVSGKIVSSLPFPLPPIEEQERISAKVDELMALCDRLEGQQADAEAVHATLVKTFLDTLTQSQDADDFTANWHRLSQHFPTIFTTEANVDALKQTVLQLAIMGKLVRQVPADGSAGNASDGGKIVTPLRENDAPYLLPPGWRWARFGSVWESSFYGPRFGAGEYVSDGGIPTIRTTDMSEDGRIQMKSPPQVRVLAAKLDLYQLRKGDLLVTRSGSIGKMAIFDQDAPAIPSAYLIRIRVLESVTPWFCFFYLRSPLGQELLGLSAVAVGVPNVSATRMAQFPCPIPPLAEQRRIVAKVDELLALCDTLKAQIAESRKVQRLLAIALIDQTLAA